MNEIIKIVNKRSSFAVYSGNNKNIKNNSKSTHYNTCNVYYNIIIKKKMWTKHIIEKNMVVGGESPW